MRSRGSCMDPTCWDGAGCEHGEGGPRLVTQGTRVRWLSELWVLRQLAEVFLLQLPFMSSLSGAPGLAPWIQSPTYSNPGSLSHASDLDEVSAPALPRAVLAVVGAARPPASAPPGWASTSPGILGGIEAGAPSWRCPVPHPSLLSSSSPYRAPSPVWPSSRSSRKQLLRATAASHGSARPEPVPAPGLQGGSPGPTGCSSLCTPTDSGPAAHGLCDVL